MTGAPQDAGNTSDDLRDLASDLGVARQRVVRLMEALVAIRDYSGDPSAAHAWDMEMRRIADEALRREMPLGRRTEEGHDVS